VSRRYDNLRRPVPEEMVVMMEVVDSLAHTFAKVVILLEDASV